MTIRMVVLKRRHLNWTRLIWHWLSQKFVGDLQKFATGPQDGDEEAIQIENTFYEVPQLPELLSSFQIFSRPSNCLSMVFMSCRVLQSLKVSYRPMTTSRTSLNRPAIAEVAEDYLTLNVCSTYVRSSCALRFWFLQFVAQALEQFQRVVTLEAARGSEAEVCVGHALRVQTVQTCS